MKYIIKKRALLSFLQVFISMMAFGQLIPPSQYLHDTKGNVDVNGAGQLQFTLPIAQPPGVRNVGPDVSLVYTNGSFNGVAGYGWNISGTTSISRTGRDIERDGAMKGIQLDYSDYYSFNGQRLILKSGEYGKDGAEYVTEKYSNTKFKSVGAISGQTWNGPEYWEVTFADGTQSWYGATTSGDSNARTPLEYNIVKWKDPQGNYITYNYIQDPESHVAVISSIKWGGNENLSKPHFNEIAFTYNETTTRELVEQSYVNGISLIQDKLLNNITVKSNGSQFRKYDITYDIDDTKYQYVKKIQEFNADNEPSNPIDFSRETNNFYNNTMTVVIYPSFANVVLSGDFRGIHTSDLIINRTDWLGGDPAGYYLQYGDALAKYYLGSENVFKNAIPINIKDANNIVSSRQGFVSYSINSTTKDITLSYYLIDLTKRVDIITDSYPNALTLVGTKVIPGNQWDESENSPPDIFYQYQKISDITKLIPYDIEGDGVPEVLLVKTNKITHRQCSTPENHFPTEDDCTTETYDEDKYIVVKQQDHSFPFFEFDLDKSENLLFGDFNGDGVEDIGQSITTTYTVINGESVPENTLQAFNVKKDSQGNLNLTEIFSANYSGLSSKTQIADFNGDGISDLFVRTDINNHYIINLNTGKNFVKTPYFNDFNPTEEYTSSQNGNYSTAKVLDINKDGKSDIVNFSTNYNIASSTSATTTYTIKVSENNGYLNGKIQFGSTPPLTQDFDSPFIVRELIGLKQNDLFVYSPPQNQQNHNMISYFNHYASIPESVIKGIVQGGRSTYIVYNDENTSVKNYYKPLQTVQYPLMELENANSQLVSLISESSTEANVSRFKQYRYRGLVVNLHNKKTIGFRQTATSSWNSKIYPGYSLFSTHIWSGTETDPLKEGVPIKEWSIRTNDESKVFPSDISENNNELLSFQSTTYQNDKLINGQVTTSISDDEKPFVVTAIVPKITKAKDFLTDIVAENSITYGEYYLPSQAVSKINNTYAVKTTNYLYDNNPSGVGINYYIGRSTSKTETVQAYNDSKSSNQEFTYENNLIKTLKNWNRDNTEYTLDTFSYDDFGNITQKISGNSIDSQTITSGYDYEPKGRFLVGQTDNLGLQTVTTYNDWGQVLTKTDPFDNTVTNTYDGWAKILTSTNNLGGTNTYTYEKDAQYNVTVTENAPDGDISKKYINAWGREYKVSTKAFEQGKFISKETQYDVLGRKIKESEPYFEGQSASQWNVIAYDDAVYPAIVTATAFNGKQTTTTVSGLKTSVKEVNGYGRTISQTADALGNMVSSSDKGGTITFSYNAAGEQIQAKYGNNIVSTKYDSWGRKSEFNDPANGLYRYEYDGFGRATKTISPKGEKTYSYNNFGQLFSQQEFSTADGGLATNKDISYTYYPNGLLNTKSGTSKGQAFNATFSYDTHGRLAASAETSNGRTYAQLNTVYDDKGRISSYERALQSSGILSNVAIENVYSPWNGELYQIKDKKSGKILWELKETNVKGQVLSANLGAANITNTYDANGFLSNVNHSSTVKPSILQLSYSFDAIKNELNTRTTGGDFSIIESFDYDENNRLINWTNPITGIKPASNRNVYDEKGRIVQNDQVGTIKFENSAKTYQATGMTLNAEGVQNYDNDLIQTISFNENNDPVYIDGEKGDVGFQYGLTGMRQRVTYGGNFSPDQDGIFTKFYNEDGSFEVVKNNATGEEKHILYIGGTPYESTIVYLKNFTESSGSYKFLHKDYIGSILAISDEAGNKLEQRHFDAWGNFTHLQLGNGAIITDKNAIDSSSLLIERGYTSHEHLPEVGIIHMNGRIYDPLLRRFLNADENIQDPTNTQNYNKYGYVMNNPMMYNDPSGELWGWIVGALVGSYFSGVQANNGQLNPVKWNWQTTWTSVIGGAFAGAAIGQGVTNINVNGTRLLQNSVIGAVGSIFNGLASGQNIFKSALTGFSGVNYSFNISGNNSMTSINGIDAGYKYIISPSYGDNDLYGPDQENPQAFWYFDGKGQELLNHWLEGSGKSLNFEYDKSWSDYMSKNGFIRDELTKRALARSYMMYSERKTKYSEMSGNFAFEIDNTYNTGYGMLHGTQYFSYFVNGRYVKATDSYVFNFNLKWTDQINHNSNVLMDKFFNYISRKSAHPADYWITIKWSQTITIKNKQWENLR